jgi:hypothetical protein
LVGFEGFVVPISLLNPLEFKTFKTYQRPPL